MAGTSGTSVDELTGLLNRNAVVQMVQEDVRGASDANPLSVALLDVDRFAALDHQYGIEAGDALLREVAKELCQLVGSDVRVARYSRDTFLLIFPGKSADDTFLATEKIRAFFDDRPLQLQTADGLITAQITLSGGVASYPSLADNDRELLRNAHAALFRAKTNGRARTAFAHPERLEPKTVHFAPGQLRRLGELSHMTGRSDASLLREGLDDLLAKYYSERTH
ncbi:MAG: hypothetical protein HW403_794 [Dehalococcoidia bacterium]|nr:hypothetical protein [Dehalococcoidia bacterium]